MALGLTLPVGAAAADEALFGPLLAVSGAEAEVLDEASGVGARGDGSGEGFRAGAGEAGLCGSCTAGCR